MHWETLLGQYLTSAFAAPGRFLVTELLTPHRVLSTSACTGGQSEAIRYLVNHQSCEGSAHHERHACMMELGLEALSSLGLPGARASRRLRCQHGHRGQHELCHGHATRR